MLLKHRMLGKTAPKTIGWLVRSQSTLFGGLQLIGLRPWVWWWSAWRHDQFFFIKAITRVGLTLLRRSEWVSKNSDSSNGEKSGVAEPPSLPGDRTWTRASATPLNCGIVGAATHGITAIQVSHSRQHTTPPLSLDSFSFHNDPVFRIDKLQAKYFRIRMSNNSFLGRMR